MFSFEKKPTTDIDELTRQALNDGHNSNYPITGTLPNAISSIESNLRDYRDNQLDRAQTELHKIQETADTELAKIVESGITNGFSTRLKNLYGFNADQVISEINNRRLDFNQRNSDFIRFRKLHQIGMMPIRAVQNRVNLYLILFILFAIEATMNAIAFKEIGGMLVAYTLSASQAFVNIITCYIVGSKIIGGAIYRRDSKRILYLLSFASHMFFITWLNLSLGLYRAISTNDPMVAALEPERLRIAMMPFSHLDQYEMTSALVAAVGFVLALLAYLKGFYSDDPFPGYGERYRIVLTSRKRIFEYISKVHKDIVSIKKEFDLACVEVHKQGLGGINKWSDAINSLEKIFVDYANILKITTKEFISCQEIYVQNFKSTVVDDKKRGSIKVSDELFPAKDFDLDIVFSDVKHYFHTDENRQKKRDNYVDEFEDMHKTVTARFNGVITKLKDETDNVIKENSSLSIG